MKQVENYLHACSITGEDPLITAEDATPKRKAFNAAERISTWCEASNKLNGFVINLADPNQVRFHPWHRINRDKSLPSGFGLSSYDYADTHSITLVGSRLQVGSEEEAEYIGSHPEALADYEAWNR